MDKELEDSMYQVVVDALDDMGWSSISEAAEDHLKAAIRLIIDDPLNQEI